MRHNGSVFCFNWMQRDQMSVLFTVAQVGPQESLRKSAMDRLGVRALDKKDGQEVVNLFGPRESFGLGVFSHLTISF